MLSKCANPVCPNLFLYLHHGKLFRIEVGLEDSDGQQTQKTAQSLEFFWLCNDCSAKLTVRYEKGVGVTTVPLPDMQAKAASTS
jgi:hypothetical protein